MERATPRVPATTPLSGSPERGTEGGDGAPVTIRLLGQASLAVGGHPAKVLGSPRLQQLLARLTVDAAVAQSRSRLAFELWPDSTDAQARTNLRKVLHELRTVLPGADRLVAVDTRTVQWRSGTDASVDVIAFAEAMAAGDLLRAVEAYGGDLLPGCYDDWVLAARDRLRTSAVDALRRLATSALERGDDAAALRHGRRAVELDPMDEAGYRLVMEAHVSRGERGEALRAYHRCVDVLIRELGVEPDGATRALYEKVRSGGTPATPSRRPSPRPHPADDTPAVSALIGRDAEWTALSGVWREAAHGRGRIVLVTGEAGVGKSRLVEELGRHVSQAGGVVASTRAYEAAGRLPWGPVIDWLRSEPVHGALGGLDTVWLTELARLLPEIRASRSDLGEAPPLDPARRYQLFDAVARALLAVGRPLLLVVDDVQWCDVDTLEMVGFLVRTARETPVLIAATARAEEIDDGALRSLVADVTHDGSLVELALDRLDAAGTAALAARLLGAPLEASAAERLWAETEGNPLFVVEAVRAGFGRDLLDGRPSVTPTVQAVIGSRLARLSPDARSMVDVAGTIGRAFTIGELVHATGRNEEDLVDPLDELWRRRIIRGHGSAYDFTHDKLREVAQAQITPFGRRRLNRLVAEALIAVHGAASGPVSARVAAHYEEAGLVVEAVHAHREAAAHALTVLALDDAVGALRRAIALLELLPAGRARDELEVELRVALGGPLVAVEGYGSVATRDSYQRAVTLCGHLGGRADPAALRGLGLAHVTRAEFARSAHFAALLLADDDPEATMEGHYLAGVTAFWRGDLAASRQHLARAVAAYRPDRALAHLSRFAQDPKAVCLVRLAVTTLWLGHQEEALALAERAEAFAAGLDHPTTFGYVLLFAGTVAGEVGDRARLDHVLRLGDTLSARQRVSYFTDLGRPLILAWRDLIDGGPVSIEPLVDALDAWRADGQLLHYTYALSLLARAHHRAGRLEAGLVSVRQALAFCRDHDQRYNESELLRLEGELLEALGDPGGAEASLRDAQRVAREQSCTWLERRADDALARFADGNARR